MDILDPVERKWRLLAAMNADGTVPNIEPFPADELQRMRFKRSVAASFSTAGALVHWENDPAGALVMHVRFPKWLVNRFQEPCEVR